MDNEVLDAKKTQSHDDVIVVNDVNGCTTNNSKEPSKTSGDRPAHVPARDDGIEDISDDECPPVSVQKPKVTDKAVQHPAPTSAHNYQSPDRVLDLAASDSDVMSDYSIDRSNRENRAHDDNVLYVEPSSPYDGNRNSEYESADESFEKDRRSLDGSSIGSEYSHFGHCRIAFDLNMNSIN